MTHHHLSSSLWWKILQWAQIKPLVTYRLRHFSRDLGSGWEVALRKWFVDQTGLPFQESSFLALVKPLRFRAQLNRASWFESRVHTFRPVTTIDSYEHWLTDDLAGEGLLIFMDCNQTCRPVVDLTAFLRHHFPFDAWFQTEHQQGNQHQLSLLPRLEENRTPEQEKKLGSYFRALLLSSNGVPRYVIYVEGCQLLDLFPMGQVGFASPLKMKTKKKVLRNRLNQPHIYAGDQLVVRYHGLLLMGQNHSHFPKWKIDQIKSGRWSNLHPSHYHDNPNLIDAQSGFCVAQDTSLSKTRKRKGLRRLIFRWKCMTDDPIMVPIRIALPDRCAGGCPTWLLDACFKEEEEEDSFFSRWFLMRRGLHHTQNPDIFPFEMGRKGLFSLCLGTTELWKSKDQADCSSELFGVPRVCWMEDLLLRLPVTQIRDPQLGFQVITIECKTNPKHTPLTELFSHLFVKFD